MLPMIPTSSIPMYIDLHTRTCVYTCIYVVLKLIFVYLHTLARIYNQYGDGFISTTKINVLTRMAQREGAESVRSG